MGCLIPILVKLPGQSNPTWGKFLGHWNPIPDNVWDTKIPSWGIFGMWKIHVRENIGTFNSHAGKILGQEIPITREKKRDIPVSCKGLVSFSQSGKFTKKTTKTLKQPTLFTSWELQNITCDIAMNSSIWTINGWSLSKFWFSHFCCKFLILFDSCEHSLLSISDASML